MNQSKEPSAQSFLRRDIVRDFWRLAPPIVLVQMSTHLAGFVDTVLIGRVGEVELGASGIGNSIFLFASIFGMGAAMGLDPVAAQHFGAGEPRRARSAYWQGVYLSCFMSVPLMLLCWALTTNLTMFGVVAELAVETEAYVLGRLPSLVAVVLLMTMRSYLQAARYTRAIVWGAIWANVFNFVADWILIYGDAGLVELGLPAIGVEPMGTFGVGAASSVAAFIQVMVFLVGITDVPIGDGDGEISVRAFCWPVQRQLLRIGIPVGLQLVTEVGFFGAVQLLMGGLGTLASASHQAALMMASMTFSVCLGVGAATSVQVGRAIGAGRRDDLKSATALGLVVGVGFMTLTAVMMWTVPGHLAGLMTNDPTIVDAAIKLLMVAGFFQIVDGIQAIAAGALRGAARTREAFVGNLIGHWLVGMPSGLFLCYGLGMGGAGLWWGLTIGLTVTAVILVVKLKTLLGGEIVAIGQRG